MEKSKIKRNHQVAPLGFRNYPLIYHEIKSRFVPVSLTFTRNFVYKKSFLGD